MKLLLLIISGLSLGTLGAFAGSIAGDAACGSGCWISEWVGRPYFGMLIGAIIGVSILIPVGLHLANGLRSQLPYTLLTSIGIGIVGVWASAPFGWGIAIPTAVFQIWTCIAIAMSADPLDGRQGLNLREEERHLYHSLSVATPS